MRPLQPSPSLVLAVAAATLLAPWSRGADAGGAASERRQSVATDTVRVDGSNGVMPLVAALAAAYQREHPSSAIVFGKGMGSGARLAALRDGRIDIALASHGLDTAQLRRDGFTPHRVATTAVVVGVNASAPVQRLASAQLCAIFTGSDSTWDRVLGAPGAVAMHAVARAESEVDMEVIRREVACLAKVPIASHVRIAADTDEMRRALLVAPGAIGVTTATVVEQEGGRLRALALDGVEPTAANVASGRYRLVRDSYLVTASAPSPAVARFLDWVRGPAAERVLAANGAVRVR